MHLQNSRNYVCMCENLLVFVAALAHNRWFRPVLGEMLKECTEKKFNKHFDTSKPSLASDLQTESKQIGFTNI